MKTMDELEGMTFWDITTNEGALTNLILGLAMVLLSIMYTAIGIFYKIKSVCKK